VIKNRFQKRLPLIFVHICFCGLLYVISRSGR